MKDLDRFTSQYQVSKTLRFELKPTQETEKHIREKGIIDTDTKLANSYKQMKATIDEFHKDFIDRALSTAKLKHLDAFCELYFANAEEKKAEKYVERLKSAQSSLRKEIAGCFKADKDYEILDKKELIQKKLKKWIDENNLELYFDPDFNRITTYFSGYNKNRMNLYSDENKATAVAHRLIDENLPKFLDNISIYEKVKQSEAAKNFPDICRDMKPWLNDRSLDELFSASSYSATLTQKQINAYNTIIGGLNDGNRKLQGLNEYITSFNQHNPDAKLPKFKKLYKQLLSDRISASWLPEAFDNAQEMFDSIASFAQNVLTDTMIRDLQTVLGELPKRDLAYIYIRNDSSLSDISNRLFGYYGVFGDALTAAEEIDKGKKTKGSKKADCISIKNLQTAVDRYIPTLDEEEYASVLSGYSENCVAAYFSDKLPKIPEISNAYIALQPCLAREHDKRYQLSEEDKTLLKSYLDKVMELLHFIKPLCLKEDASLKKDEMFYSSFTPLYDQLKQITKLYDKVRNFATKKPYSTEKIKLNFEYYNENFLGGWVDSKTDTSDNGTQYGGYLFRRKNNIGEYDYYLGISSDKKLFRHFNPPLPECESEFERLDYYQPKATTIYGNSYKGEKTYPERKADLLEYIDSFIKNNADDISVKLSRYRENPGATPNGYLNAIFDEDRDLYEKLLSSAKFQKLNNIVIDELKETLRSMKRLPNAATLADKDYKLFSEVIDDIDAIAKQKIFNYFHINKEEFEQASTRSDKPLYLFRISNKDLSYAENLTHRKHRGKDNLHTLYFKALMSGEQTIYDLGTAEVFYRQKSIDRENYIIHPANIPLNKKNPELKSRGEKSVFSYDIIKDRRYTLDKFQLHLSMIANYTEKSNGNNINKNVCEYLNNNPDINIIGIDRGERNLLYISMINRDGNVVKDSNGNYIQYSLNEITGEYKKADGTSEKFSTPYHCLLDDKGDRRNIAREKWGVIENIKELKSGYMSQVVHIISKLMVEYNAIVVMEDLNGGFKNSRKKVEKQVYQNFEKALIEKLNYLVFKDYPVDACGGLYHALQLTNKFESFGKLTKQTGFIFYVPAWNTSKIDPVTGFVDMLKPKYKSVTDAKSFFGKFDSICFNPEKGWFEFSFDYSNFTEKANGTKTDWTVCTYGDLRYTFNKKLNDGNGGYEKCNVTEKLKELFDKNDICYADGKNLICAITAQDKAGFFAELIKCLQVTLAMRYSYSCKEEIKDFILSPVANEKGEFFCSEGRTDGLPQDADANGAYNIARKGLCVLKHIDTADKYSDQNTKITNKEWLNFVRSYN